MIRLELEVLGNRAVLDLGDLGEGLGLDGLDVGHGLVIHAIWIALSWRVVWWWLIDEVSSTTTIITILMGFVNTSLNDFLRAATRTCRPPTCVDQNGVRSRSISRMWISHLSPSTSAANRFASKLATAHPLMISTLR